MNFYYKELKNILFSKVLILQILDKWALTQELDH